jgi:predicted transport protein
MRDMEPALQTMIDNMPEKTGKSLDEWKAILKTKNFEKHGEAMSFLKKEKGVTHGFANMIIQLSKENQGTDEELVVKQYEGKESLKPVYNKLLEVIMAFGDDITKTPKKDSVSLIRKRQFALIKPATKTRIDLGLKLKGKPETERLGNSGPFGTMCTHRVKIETATEVNEELVSWLREAYEGAK